MYSPPYIFFHSPKGYRWEDGTDPALQKLRTINVSQPDALMTWLETNSASRISNLFIFLDAPSSSPSPQRWCRLFDALQQEAANIQHLSVYWDAEGPWGTRPPWNIRDLLHFGLGKSVVFVRRLAQLRVKKSVEISGFYTKYWPRYLEEKIGLMPVNKENIPGSYWERALRDYQAGTERLNPWIDTKDGSLYQPFNPTLLLGR